MLVIRKEQMEAMEEYMLRSLKKRMVSHLRANYPEETAEMSDDELDLLVKSGIDKAESYDIIEDDDVRRFLEFMVINGENFDKEDPEAEDILTDDEMDSDEKMDELDYYYSESEEEE